MGRKKKVGNGLAAAVKTAKAAKAAKATKKVNGAKLKAPGDAVKLTADDKRWFENLMLKEQLVKQEAEAKMTRLIADEQEMFAAIQKRTGYLVKGWTLDWNTMVATPKVAPKAKPGPKPKPKQGEPQQAQAD